MGGGWERMNRFFPTPCPKYICETAQAKVSGTYPKVSDTYPGVSELNPGVSGPPRPDQHIWWKCMSLRDFSKFVDEIGLGWSNK
jgi:hypothetical protein